jgi:hypothetical protein
MINETDIEAFADDLEAADRIVERAKRGVPSGRHIMADEEIPLIRAFVLMRSQLTDAAKFMQELHQRELKGMELGEPRKE